MTKLTAEAVKVELFIGSWVDYGAINYNEGRKEEVETGFAGKTAMKSVLGLFNHPDYGLWNIQLKRVSPAILQSAKQQLYTTPYWKLC